MPIKSINPIRCNGCGLCVEFCSSDVIRMGKNQKAFIKYPEDCSTCYLCGFLCHQYAIEIAPVKSIKVFGKVYRSEAPQP